MPLTTLLQSLGPEVEDAEEESFLLFSQDIPSSNLGFVDSRATTVDITIHGQDYSIHQSPTLLSSSRAGGTTGAVLWKITPLFAEWISHAANPLWRHDLLSPLSTVVELGCGISALTALALSPLVEHYIATDQEYVRRLFRENLASNPPAARPSKTKGKRRNRPKPETDASLHSHITFTSLDWETDVPDTLKDSIPTTRDRETDGPDKGFDLVLSCDCIYNEALVAPFVRTCADICRLRPVYDPAGETGPRSPTLCIIAQQQRSPDVFETWLAETLRCFRVWRLSDEMVGDQLQLGSGYLVHLLVLRSFEVI